MGGPSSPKRLQRGAFLTIGLAEARLRPAGYDAAAFACFATIGHGVLWGAVACEASEGWWSQAGSNRRPLACHASALPAELWPQAFLTPQTARAATLITKQG